MLEVSERINSKKDLIEWIKYESKKYPTCGRGIRKIFPITEADILKKHQVILRKAEYFLNTGKKMFFVIYKIRLSYFQNKYAYNDSYRGKGGGTEALVWPVLEF